MGVRGRNDPSILQLSPFHRNLPDERSNDLAIEARKDRERVNVKVKYRARGRDIEKTDHAMTRALEKLLRSLPTSQAAARKSEHWKIDISHKSSSASQTNEANNIASQGISWQCEKGSVADSK